MGDVQRRVLGHRLDHRVFPISDARKNSSRNEAKSVGCRRGTGSAGSFKSQAELSIPSLSIDQFPIGLSSAPFVWEYLQSQLKMEFLGGFVGVRQETDSLRLRPEIGWAIRERG